MDIKELKQRAGIVEQVGRTDEELIKVLNLAISKLDFGRPDDTRYYIAQVIQDMRERSKQQQSPRERPDFRSTGLRGAPRKTS